MNIDAEQRTTDAQEDFVRTKRNTFVLAAAQAIVGSGGPIAISLGGLGGWHLLADDKSLATAPVTAFTVGVAVGALPAAWFMRLVGRRQGFMSGALVTATGGATAAWALFHDSFWLFAAALFVIGAGNAFVQQYRFAAADAAPAASRTNAISWVLAGGVFTAIIGPQAVILTKDLFLPVPFAGAFISAVVLGIAGMAILSLLDVREPARPDDNETSAPARPLLEIVARQRFITALMCAIGSYALMSFLMTGAPLAMVGCGFTTDLATLGIQWHVMAMFGPSFFTGHLIRRFGKDTIVGIGLMLLLACAVVALLGIELWNFWLALVLLGLGWNFGFIGATAMVTDTYRPSEKNKVQGFHDVTLFSAVAFASLMSGQVLDAYGWAMLSWILIPVAAFCLLLLLLQVAAERRVASQGDDL